MVPAPAAASASISCSRSAVGTYAVRRSEVDVRLSNGTGACRPRACARASFTPGLARSALVCALKCAMPARMRSCAKRPLAPRRDVTPDSHKGWCVTIRSTRRSMASAAIPAVGSTASRTDSTAASGSPKVRPTESHGSARFGGNHRSSSVTTSASRTWARPDSNRRPSRCKRGALPAALRAQYRVPRGVRR